MAESTIYVRVDADDKKWLSQRVAQEEGWTQNHVISRLLQYLKTRSKEEQREIIEGSGDGAVAGSPDCRTSGIDPGS